MSGSLALTCLLLLGPQPAAYPARDHATDDRAAARAVLNDVLSQHAFANARRVPWSAEVRRYLREWLSNLWVQLFGGHSGRPSAARALAWIASAAALCLLIVWLWRVQYRTRRAKMPSAVIPVPDERGWRALAREAVDLIRAGETREGARLAYRSAVQRLEEDGAFSPDTTRTPREFLRLIPTHHRRRPALAMLTTAFERIWYGSRVASEDEGRDIVTLLQELECVPRERVN